MTRAIEYEDVLDFKMYLITLRHIYKIEVLQEVIF